MSEEQPFEYDRDRLDAARQQIDVSKPDVLREALLRAARVSFDRKIDDQLLCVLLMHHIEDLTIKQNRVLAWMFEGKRLFDSPGDPLPWGFKLARWWEKCPMKDRL